MNSIDIIGAGICGLTTALALEKNGLKTNIYEQTTSLKPVGAGIILASNAMKVYRNLGIENQIKAVGIPLNSLNITKPSLEIITKNDLKYFKEKYDLQSIVVHRKDLQQILLNNLKETNINFGFKLKEAIKKEDGYILHFENGNSIKSNIILGADGIHSKIRKAIITKAEIRNTNQICWRGVTQFNLPTKYKNELNEAWGKGSRFAFVEYSKNKIYWYAVKSFKVDENEFSKEELNNYFNDYHPIANEIINKTDINKIHTAIIKDLKPIKKWHDEFICLIGDAAHATTPNMGQGACQAIEDAYVIANSIHQEKEIIKAFKTYQTKRISKAHNVVKQSLVIGSISHWKNPISIFTRNLIMKSIPEKMNYKQLEQLFQLDKNH